MKWLNKELTVKEVEELFRMYEDMKYYPPKGSLADRFFNSLDYLCNVEGFWKYVDIITKERMKRRSKNG